jgi:membrane associated rhomboid family serine protease
MRRLLGSVPPVVLNLILLNATMLLLTKVSGTFMYEKFALFYPGSPLFEPWQLVTHMFMHGGIGHLLFNMYALWLFGCMLEYQWNSRKFLLFYLVTGVGAALFYSFVLWLQVMHAEAQIDPEMLAQMKELLASDRIFTNATSAMRRWYEIMNTPMVGASGAVYGVLMGFGMLYPNTVLQFIFPPVSVKAKWVVVIYGALELFLGLINSGGNIAHLAHVGGMLFGFLLLYYWKRKGKMYY